MKILIKRSNSNSILPYKGSKDAACYDVIADEIIYSDRNKVVVKLGFHTKIPDNYKGLIVPRSSFTQKGWVMQNSPAQIDSDYRGEWMIKFEGIPNKSTSMGVLDCPKFPYKKGDRVAQIYFERVNEPLWEEVDTLDQTERGSGGFGSTGV